HRLFTPNAHFLPLTHRAYPLLWSITAELPIRFVGHVDLRAATGELAVIIVAFVFSIARLVTGYVRPAIIWFTLSVLLLSPEIGRQTYAGGADLILGVFLALFFLTALGWVAL